MENKKLKIGFFIDSFFPMVDGVIVVVDNYAKILNKENDVFVAAPASKKTIFSLPYRVIPCRQLKKKEWHYSIPLGNIDYKFKQELQKERPDIIHIHSPFTVGTAGIKLAKKLNIPVFATMHSQFRPDLYNVTKSNALADLIIKKIVKTFSYCDAVFVMSKKLEDMLYGYGYKGRTIILPNATDMEYPLEPQKMLDKMNAEYGLKQDEKVLLFVGRICELKGILFLVDVMKKLKEKGQSFKMFYVGTGPDEDRLKEKIKEDKLENDIILTGRITDREWLAAHYLRADLFLFPSFYDTDSLVQKEAGANKTPTLFCDGAVTAQAITDNDTGFFAPFDTEKYSDKIYEILNNEKLLKEVSENVYNKLHITWKQASQKLLETYYNEIEKKKQNVIKS